jgi:hypothetical protein
LIFASPPWHFTHAESRIGLTCFSKNSTFVASAEPAAGTSERTSPVDATTATIAIVEITAMRTGLPANTAIHTSHKSTPIVPGPRLTLQFYQTPALSVLFARQSPIVRRRARAAMRSLVSSLRYFACRQFPLYNVDIQSLSRLWAECRDRPNDRITRSIEFSSCGPIPGVQ